MSEGSEVQLTSVDGSQKKVISNISRKRNDFASEVPKFEVHANTYLFGRKKIRFIEKELPELSFIRTIDAWKLFHNAGMPVVPMYTREHKKSIYMPDLREYGWEFYGKALNKMLSHPDNSRTPKPQDALFISVMNDQYNLLTSRLRVYEEIATNHGLILPYDDPFDLGIHKNGTFQPFNLDLEQANYHFLVKPEDIPHKNRELTEQFIKTLHDIADRF